MGEHRMNDIDKAEIAFLLLVALVLLGAFWYGMS
jgi:hypothetical protein